MPTKLTAGQAEYVGRIRDALRTLGYTVPASKPGTPGTLADLAALAPAMGRFAARAGPDFVQRMRDETNPEKRAGLFAVTVEAAVQANKRTVPVGALLNAVGQGFVAFHATKNPRARIAAVLGALNQITAATSR